MCKIFHRGAAILSTLSVWALTAGADDMLKPFEVQEYVYSGGPYQDEVFRYLLLRPLEEKPGERYPLVLFFHGAGERGNDPQGLLPHFPTQMAQPEWREKFPCFLIVPQCRSERLWINQHWTERSSIPMDEQPNDQLKMALEILDQSLEELPVDRNRVYLTGLSMGGYGSWELAIRRPELFAAVAPVCGGGDEAQVARLKSVPVWTAHGDRDETVPVGRSRSMVEALRQAGGQPRYTEYPGVGHNSWTQFYADPEGVVPWMFQQRRE